MRRRSVRAIALVAALAALSLGCSEIGPSTCDRSEEGNPLVPYTEGTVENGVYMSSPWDGELLYFPGGIRYSIEHKLGVAPRRWQVYLSFDRYGTETGTLAEASGNQAEVLCVDAERVNVTNGSCVEYWMLLVADAGDASEQPAPPPTCEAPAP